MDRKRIRKATRILAFIEDKSRDGHGVTPSEVSTFLEGMYPLAKPKPWIFLGRLNGFNYIKVKRRGCIGGGGYKIPPRRYISYVITTQGMKYLDRLEKRGEHARTEMWVMHPGDDPYEYCMGRSY